MAQLRQVGIRINDACLEMTKEFQSGLQELAQECYPQDKILLLDIDSMSAEVLSLVNSIADNRDILVLSTSVDFSVPRRGYVLEVNRLINEDGEIIGIGARPGHHGLDTQFDYISKAASGRPVILVEDGVFSGKTSEHIVRSLQQKAVNVTDVVTCFAFPHGIRRLNESFPKLRVHFVHGLDNLIDWVPDHDFFPAAPNCGRVLGVKIGSSYMPYYDRCGATYAVPYILPFSPITDWASIPNGFSKRFSEYCLRKAYEFFDKLDGINGRGIEYSDLQAINPRISVPISVSSKIFTDKHERIASHLYSILRRFE
jgi:hypothetical protein